MGGGGYIAGHQLSITSSLSVAELKSPELESDRAPKSIPYCIWTGAMAGLESGGSRGNCLGATENDLPSNFFFGGTIILDFVFPTFFDLALTLRIPVPFWAPPPAPLTVGSANLTNLYLEHFLAFGIFCRRLRMVGLEYPKNSGPEPELVACLSLWRGEKRGGMCHICVMSPCMCY